MQAVSISNVLPAKAPVPGADSRLSPGPQQSSPFNAPFQAKLKAASDATKLPAAGKATDSSRAKSAASGPMDSQAIAPQLLGRIVSSPAATAPSLPISMSSASAEGTSGKNPVAATESSRSSVFPMGSLHAGQNDANSADSRAMPSNTPRISSGSSLRANVPPVAVIHQTGWDSTASASKLVSHIFEFIYALERNICPHVT